MRDAVYHTPQGSDPDWCDSCRQPFSKHLVEHVYKPNGNGLCACGLPEKNHRRRKRSHNPEYLSRKQEKRNTRQRYLHTRKRQTQYNHTPLFLGIDGEGQGRRYHNYVFLAVSDAEGQYKASVENYDGPAGLTTEQCLDFLVDLPARAKLYAYAFNYDLTKILTDLDNESLYLLFRPELRGRKLEEQQAKKKRHGPKGVKWKCNGKRYLLNMQGTKFSVKRKTRGGMWSHTVVIWDIWKFYQGAFVGACKNWEVGTAEEIEHMAHMKAHRSDFDRISRDDVKAYCFKECQFMAQLAQKLVDAHTAAGLDLKAFYGAGSSASAMLEAMGIREHIRPVPMPLVVPVSQAFFGGRFENSVIGKIEKTVYNYDISSAYPYQLCFLPCLVHGEWKHVTKRSELDGAKCALVRYKLGKLTPGVTPSWGPFPFREKTGNICFPVEGNEGWVWQDEYFAGERLFPNVEFQEAWVHESDCDCQPFKDIPTYYLERLRIGKDAAGIVLKLAMNSCYGKLAQSIGLAIFNNWIWAGLITSGARAQLLEVLGLHKNWSNMLMLATDGVFSLERFKATVPDATKLTKDARCIAYQHEKEENQEKHVKGCDCPIRFPLNGTEVPLAAPRDTGTFSAPKPLGGWEEKVITKGMFVARPGVYFPLNPNKKEIKEVRGRGVGKAVMLENHARLVDAWQKKGVDSYAEVTNVSRFCGAKSSVSRVKWRGRWRYKRAAGGFGARAGQLSLDLGTDALTNKPSYGQWIVRPVFMSFNPLPKRECVNPDGVTLKPRRVKGESTPYSRALISKETLTLIMGRELLAEQPDGDLTDYDVESEL